MSVKCGKSKIAVILLATLVVGAAAALVASPVYGKALGHHGGWGRHAVLTEDDLKDYSELFLKRFSRHNGATKEQQEAMKKEIDSRIPKVLDLQKRKSAIREKVLAALGEEKVDRAKLEDARKEAAQLAQEASDMVLDATMAFSGILTPEQRKKALDHFQGEHKG
jgi:Spy/CpxP family protein refolding chaperone